MIFLWTILWYVLWLSAYLLRCALIFLSVCIVFFAFYFISWVQRIRTREVFPPIFSMSDLCRSGFLSHTEHLFCAHSWECWGYAVSMQCGGCYAIFHLMNKWSLVISLSSRLALFAHTSINITSKLTHTHINITYHQIENHQQTN